MLVSRIIFKKILPHPGDVLDTTITTGYNPIARGDPITTMGAESWCFLLH